MSEPTPSQTPTGGERPTLKTIAFMTGLGITTVSRALKDAPDIGEETKKRVRLVARQIGYRPNRAGVRLRTGKTNVIALVLNTEEEVMGLTSYLVYGISEILSGTQYHLVITPYARTHDPLEPIRYIVETASADGVIFSRTEPDDARVRYLHESGFPFSTHGRTRTGIDHSFHDFDNEAFACEAVRRLCAKGRSKIALLAPPQGLTYHGHMVAGFSRGMEEAGAFERPYSGVDVDSPLGLIKQRTEQIMRGQDRPDGIVCGSGGATLGVIAGIEAAGLTIGDDIDIVSKQFTDILPWIRPLLDVANEDVRQAGRDLASAVLAIIDGSDPGAHQSLCKPRWS